MIWPKAPVCELLLHHAKGDEDLAVSVNFLSRAQISPDVQVKLISCLINAGIHFSTATSAYVGHMAKNTLYIFLLKKNLGVSCYQGLDKLLIIAI
jgi:hypothetical protein